ncbi:MAG: guanylate kinase [Endomicrobium sp.]|nr:guanylate kinase [Endomicrobium sp.]
MNRKLNGCTKLLGNIIIISAPSGAGKTSICKAVISESKNVTFLISYTTRPQRSGERNGREYFFVDETKFRKMIKEKEFAEWEKVHGNYYGTSKVVLERVLKTGKNILLEIDVRGGISIKRLYPSACMIFIMTPNLKTLKSRLISRNKDCRKIIETRFNNAKKELKFIKKYEYLVINKNLNDAIEAIKIIIKSLEYKIQNKNTLIRRYIEK